MPRLANSGHETFVQAYVANGGNGAEAYRTAYPKCKTRAAEVNGSRLLRNAEVLARVAELQVAAAVRASITLDGLIREAGEIQAQAVKNNQMAAAISALIAKAKRAGFWVDRSENMNANVNYAISDEPVSEAGWVKAPRQALLRHFLRKDARTSQLLGPIDPQKKAPDVPGLAVISVPTRRADQHGGRTGFVPITNS